MADTVCPIQNKAVHTVPCSLVSFEAPPPTPMTSVRSSRKVSSIHWEAWVVTELEGWTQLRPVVMFGWIDIDHIAVIIQHNVGSAASRLNCLLNLR